MKFKILLLLTMTAILVWGAGPAMAKVESRILSRIKLDSTPVDMAVSADGKRVYILNDEGELLIYESSGRLDDTIKLEGDFSKIRIGQQENILYLSDPGKKIVSILNLEFIRKIDITNAPIKGPADAPVTLAEFSDFQ